ncbi:hypothetical protein SD81_018450 [Tolypothrix campylonemoides VB511288]|nr:hypothetical protein SD81_018450 [Tolypothrix campylonemoides VB511288]
MADKTVLEAEEQLEPKEAVVVYKETPRRLPRKPQQHWLAPLLVGTGLGIAIAAGGAILLDLLQKCFLQSCG